ncbi:Mediator of RNA polymerase II transcription subunit 30 [Mactra antiquata]
MATPNQQIPMTSPSSIPGTLSNMGMNVTSSQPVFTQSQTSQSQGVQSQQSFTGAAPATAPTSAVPQMMSPTKSVNSVALCKLGQETTQDVAHRLLDVFKLFKSMPLPNGSNNSQCQERRMKIDESLRQLSLLFRKLRVIYDKVSEVITDPNENPEQVLVPLIGEQVEDRNTNTDTYQFMSEEHKQLVEQLTQKNRLMKEVIDKIRTIIWEINTMIVMRKT